jgi:hypothetical protein
MKAALLLLLCCPASAAWTDATALWQERYFWDALLQARDRVARGQSDPAMVPTLKAMAGQAAQQVANLQQIAIYVKAQQDNLRFAFTQDDPSGSLATIGANFETLGKGADQVRSNLYYLTSRCRMAQGQALPDPEMYNATLAILTQVQQLQLQLNALYLDTVEDRRLIYENGWAADKAFKLRIESLLRSVVRVQDSVFSVYNAGYELAMRSR